MTSQPDDLTDGRDGYVHVRINDTGAIGSIRTERFDPEIYEKTGDDPLDHHGEAKAWKPKTTVDREATASKTAKAAKQAAATGQSADTPKES